MSKSCDSYILEELLLYYCLSSRLIRKKNYLACRTDDQPSSAPTVTALLYAAMSVNLRGLNNWLRDGDRCSSSFKCGGILSHAGGRQSVLKEER